MKKRRLPCLILICYQLRDVTLIAAPHFHAWYRRKVPDFIHAYRGSTESKQPRFSSREWPGVGQMRKWKSLCAVLTTVCCLDGRLAHGQRLGDLININLTLMFYSVPEIISPENGSPVFRHESTQDNLAKCMEL